MSTPRDGPRRCSFDGCDRAFIAKGWCSGHYYQVCVKGRRPSPLKEIACRLSGDLGEAIRARSEPGPGGCRVWTAGRTTDGYGALKVDGRSQPAHRVAWCLANGPIPERLFVDHICGVRACVNVEHLRLATRAENNSYRVSVPRNNTSGYLGVYQKRNGRWRGHVSIRGRRYYAPTCDTPEEVDEWLRRKRRELLHATPHREWVEENNNRENQ